MRQVFGGWGVAPKRKEFQFLRYGLAPVAADEYISYCSGTQSVFCVGIIIILNHYR